jgi:hypothetical protein
VIGYIGGTGRMEHTPPPSQKFRRADFCRLFATEKYFSSKSFRLKHGYNPNVGNLIKQSIIEANRKRNSDDAFVVKAWWHFQKRQYIAEIWAVSKQISTHTIHDKAVGR